jgi:hypothetical protein
MSKTNGVFDLQGRLVAIVSREIARKIKETGGDVIFDMDEGLIEDLLEYKKKGEKKFEDQRNSKKL